MGKFLMYLTNIPCIRYTVTFGMNALGQIGYITITFKEKKNQFGPIVMKRLRKKIKSLHLDFNIWLQCSRSGMFLFFFMKHYILNKIIIYYRFANKK